MGENNQHRGVLGGARVDPCECSSHLCRSPPSPARPDCRRRTQRLHHRDRGLRSDDRRQARESTHRPSSAAPSQANQARVRVRTWAVPNKQPAVPPVHGAADLTAAARHDRAPRSKPPTNKPHSRRRSNAHRRQFPHRGGWIGASKPEPPAVGVQTKTPTAPM